MLNLSNISKKQKFLAKSLVAVLLVAWLLTAIDWKESWRVAKSADTLLLGGYMALYGVGLVISSEKWRRIARFKGFERSFGACFRAYLSGVFVNNFLPGFVGGDAYRTHWLGKQREGYSRAVSTVVFDRVSGLYMAGLLATVFAISQYALVSTSSMWSLLTTLIGIGIFAITFWSLVWRKASNLPFLIAITKFFPPKLRIFLEEVRDCFRKEVLIAALSFSALFQLIGVGIANWVLFMAFGQTIAIESFFAVIFVITIVSSIPISVNNIGVKEWAYYAFFPLIGVAPEVAVTAAVASRLLQMIVSFVALPDFLRRRSVEVTDAYEKNSLEN